MFNFAQNSTYKTIEIYVKYYFGKKFVKVKLNQS
jgi:hypothetical protein